MRNFEYLLPASIDQAAQALADKDTLLKAAGTDVLDLMKAYVQKPKRLVNLLSVPGMREIATDADGLHIGALVTLTQLAEDVKVPAILRQAAEEAATPQIRNVGTVAGNLCQRPRCWYLRNKTYACLKKGGSTCFAQEGENKYHAVFDNKPCAIVHASNLATALLALGGKLVTNKREISIDDFFVLPQQNLMRENVLADGEIVTKIVVTGRFVGGAYMEAREKQAFDWALVSAAVVMDQTGGVVRNTRVALGSVAPVPRRAPAVEAMLAGKKLTAKLAEQAAAAAFEGVTPLSDNAYKIPLGRAILKRAILAAAGMGEPVAHGEGGRP